MTDYHHSIYEYLFTSKELLTRGDLADIEAEALREKIEHISALLGEE